MPYQSTCGAKKNGVQKLQWLQILQQFPRECSWRPDHRFRLHTCNVLEIFLRNRKAGATRFLKPEQLVISIEKLGFDDTCVCQQGDQVSRGIHRKDGRRLHLPNMPGKVQQDDQVSQAGHWKEGRRPQVPNLSGNGQAPDLHVPRLPHHLLWMCAQGPDMPWVPGEASNSPEEVVFIHFSLFYSSSFLSSKFAQAPLCWENFPGLGRPSAAAGGAERDRKRSWSRARGTRCLSNSKSYVLFLQLK